MNSKYFIDKPLWFIFLIFSLSLLSTIKVVSAQNGNSVFNDHVLHIIEFKFVDVSQISNPYYKGIYQSVEMKIDGHVMSQVGLTTKGEKSYAAAQYDKKPFKIKTDKYISGQKYDGIKRFNLHNNTYDYGIMREKLTSDAARRLGIPAPKVAFAEVFINGSYWGIYTLVEAQDEIYKRTFGDNDGYAMESFGSAAQLDNLAYYGNKPEDYKGQYIVDHGNDSATWSLWIKLMYKVNTLPARVVYVDSLSHYMDYLSFFRFNAVLDYNLNAEPKNKNGIYYFDQTSRIWHTICWDQNVSFPDFGDPGQNSFPNTQLTALLDKYSTYPQFSEAYNNTLCRLSTEIFTETELAAKIAAYRKLIDASVEKDTRKGFTYKQYELSLKNLQEFIQERNLQTLSFLKKQNYSCTSTSISKELVKSEIQIFPVPATQFLNVVCPEQYTPDYSITTISGVLMQTGKLKNAVIDLTGLPPAMYILKITYQNKLIKVQKILKIES